MEQIRPSSSDDDNDYFDSVNPRRKVSSVSINFDDRDITINEKVS
jgi:hypothetical protein